MQSKDRQAADVPSPEPESGTDPCFPAGEEYAFLSEAGIDPDVVLACFQKDAGLKADGICGPLTWAALDDAPTTPKFTVTIPHLNKAKADGYVKNIKKSSAFCSRLGERFSW